MFKLISDEEIMNIKGLKSSPDMSNADKFMVLLRAVAQAQRASCEKQHRERLRKIKKNLEKYCPHNHTDGIQNRPKHYCEDCWQASWKGLGL